MHNKRQGRIPPPVRSQYTAHASYMNMYMYIYIYIYVYIEYSVLLYWFSVSNSYLCFLHL
jgi:hypothetical protein